MIGRALRRHVHVSWMVAIGCIGIVAGVVLAGEAVLPLSLAWLLTGTALWLTAAIGGRGWLVVMALLGGLFVGAWRGSALRAELAQTERYVGQSITAIGTLSEDVDYDKRGQLVLRLRDVEINGRYVAGALWVTADASMDAKRSDRVCVTGKLRQGFGSFVGSMYDARLERLERPVLGDIALRVRDYFGSGVRRALTDTEASLGLGYVVGQRRGLPEELDAALQAAGLTHIVVASGYNLTILVRLSRRLFEKVSKYLSLLVSGGMIAGFIAITGASPSMSRAGLVAGLGLLAWYYGRRFHPLVLLPFAMAVTLMVQPTYAWGDLGWQLSFAAFAGVMILAPLLQVYFFGDKPERAVRRIFIETMAATIATLPILIVPFGQFSVVAPIANMLILPLVPLAMLLTFIAGIGGLLVPQQAFVIGAPAQALLSYMTTTARFMGDIPWAVQTVDISTLAACCAYAAIALACVYMIRVTKYDLRRSSLVE